MITENPFMIVTRDRKVMSDGICMVPEAHIEVTDKAPRYVQENLNTYYIKDWIRVKVNRIKPRPDPELAAFDPCI